MRNCFEGKRTLAVGTVFLVVVGALLGNAGSAWAQAPSFGGEEAPGEQRPNILWISAEDLSPRLGAYGDAVARTPNLDRLARQGMRFTHAFTTAGQCAPSRSAIITGMYQNAIGAQHHRTTTKGRGLPTPYRTVPPPHVKAFTEYLRAAGYYTTNNYKNDFAFGTPATMWNESSRNAHWRHRPDEDQPFFSVFNLGATHESRVWPESDEDSALVTDPSRVAVPPYYPDTPPVRRTLARHYDNIAEMDAQVGKLLQQLEEDGLAENTVVFFWGDHGDGLPRAKTWLYDSGIRVPLLVRWPGQVEPGAVNDELVSFVDLAPTVLAMAGVEVPGHVQGRVLLGERKQEAPEHIFAARGRVDVAYDMVRAVRSRRFKYIRNFYPQKPYYIFFPYRNRDPIMQELLRLHAEGTLGATPSLWLRDQRPPEELYDTNADPHEVKNLTDDPAYRDELRRMRAEMNRWMEEIDDMGRLPEYQMVERMWPGGKQPRTATPAVLPRATAEYGSRPDTATFAGTIEVLIHAPTQGSSVRYTTDDAEGWTLYTGPFRIDETTTVRAQAVRYGFEESAPDTTTFVRTAASQ